MSNISNVTSTPSFAAANRSAVSKTKLEDRSIGNPKLSDTAKTYYDELQKKFGDAEIYVAGAEMEGSIEDKAQELAGKTNKTVVVVSQEELEKMATDKETRDRLEGAIADAKDQFAALKEKLGDQAEQVENFGVSIDENGQVSFFAVLKKQAAQQKEAAENAKEAKKAEAKEEDKAEKVTLRAHGISELTKKIQDMIENWRTENVQTAEEKNLGQHIDFTV